MPAPRLPIDVVHVMRPTAGGVRRHVVDLITGLDALGVNQALVYSSAGADTPFVEALTRMRAMGVETVELSMAREINPFADLRAAAALAKIVRRLSPWVMHLHASKAGAIGRLGALGMPNVRVVYSPHASAANISRVYALAELVLARLGVDRIVAVSASERAELSELHLVPENKLVQVDCGIDAAEVQILSQQLPAVAIPEGKLVVAVGRLAEQKNPLFLVDCAAEVVARVPEARFVWVGDGELRDAVNARVAQLSLGERWTTTGWVSNPFPFMYGATVCALPSRYESFGYTTLEAMVLGKPVVATAVAGSRDLIVSGETGELTPPGNRTAFTEALVRLLTDPERAARLGSAAAVRARMFSRERMATETLAVYRSLSS